MNSNTNPSGVKSSKVLKQEVLTQLDKIDTDLDEMQTRMTPGQMIDDVIFYPRGGSPAATFDMLRENPVGATFLTLGTLLLMEDQNHYTYEQLARARVSGVVDSTRMTARNAMTSAHERVDQIKGGISSVRERIVSKKDEARSMVSNLKSSVSSAVASGKGAVTHAKDTVTEKITGEASGNSIISQAGASSEFDGLPEAERLKAIADAKAAYSAEGSSEESGFSMNTEGMKSKISEKVSDVQDSVSGLGEKVSGVASQLSDKLTGVTDNIGSTFSGATETMGLSDIGDKLPSMDDVKGKVSGLVGDGVQAVKGIDPLTYVAIGAGLGTLTGLGLPVPEAEKAMVDKFDEKIGSFAQDLQSALNESADILKDLVVSDFKNISVNVFKR